MLNELSKQILPNKVNKNSVFVLGFFGGQVVSANGKKNSFYPLNQTNLDFGNFDLRKPWKYYSTYKTARLLSLWKYWKKFSFVKKATPLSDAKAELMQDIREAVEELKLVRAGKLKARNAEDLINEL